MATATRTRRQARSYPLLEREADPGKRQLFRLLWDSIHAQEETTRGLQELVDEIGTVIAAAAGAPVAPTVTSPTSPTPTSPTLPSLSLVPATGTRAAGPTVQLAATGSGVVTVVSDYVIGASDRVVLGDTTNGGFSVFLPGVGVSGGRELWLRNIAAANNLLVKAQTGELVEGGTTLTLVGGASAWRHLVCDGLAWWRLG